MVNATQIYETILYADDLQAAADFYVKGFGLRLLSQSELMLVLAIGERYLLIFDPEKSSAEGRLVPAHGCNGRGHVAFVASEKDLPLWRERLASANIEIESEVQWGDGDRGLSIYVRDPAGNSVELAPEILWSHLDQDANS